MRRMLLKTEERKVNEVLFGSAGMYVDPVLRGSRLISQRFKDQLHSGSMKVGMVTH